MKLLTWQDDWALGIDPVDADHRTLIGHLLDICLRFCPQAAALADPPHGIRAPGPSPIAGPGDLIEALTGFGEEVRAHCEREEAFMRAIKYPRLAEHQAEHLALMAEFDAMVSDCRARDVRVFEETTQEFIRHWILGHILGADRAFADAYFSLCGLENVRSG